MLIDQFLEFEKENKLFYLEIYNIRYWHIIRFIIFNELLKEKEQIGKAHTDISNATLFHRLVLKIKQVPDYILMNPFIFIKKSSVLVFNHQRRVKNNNYYNCLYTDKLIETINLSTFVYEQPHLESHAKPVTTKNIRYTDFINILVAIKRKSKITKFISCEEEKLITSVLQLINDKFNVKFDSDLWTKKICDTIKTYILMYPYIEKIIDKVNPKIIIEVVSYSLSRFIINDIAKKKGIPTIELQHGTMGKYHIAYNFAEKMNLNTFPDYEFLFGQFWKDNTRLPIDKSKIKVVGWPYYEQKVTEHRLIDKYKEIKVILFISQGTIGKELSKLALELVNKINIKNYKLIYKLHPGEYARWKEEYPWLLGSDIEIIDNNQHDIYHYFTRTDIQVGVYSTALFEGLGYGLETYIYKLYGHEYMEELYNQNLAKLVESVDELIMYLGTKDAKKSPNTSYLWEKNSMNNIIREINTIIEHTQKVE